jgi:D-tyrosyl-tRNA(Tyr) deacylase
MRVVVQRVSSASVTIGGTVKSSIGQGLLVLLGVGPDDGQEDLDYLVKKVSALRIFDDEEGVMNRSVVDVGGEVLVVSQFTLMASTKKGNRPSYIRAAGHELAVPMYEAFCAALSAAIGRPVGTGRFGAEMAVSLINDGPVTIIIDSQQRDF